MSGGFDLDHVAVVVHDLARARNQYSRLGFALTPRSSHKGPVPPANRVGPWGTGNHCAMFEQGYLELLGVTDPDLFHDHVDARLARYEGLHLIAFGTADASVAAAEIRSRGGRVEDPVVIGRDVPFGSGTRPGRFGIAGLDAERYPEADFLVIEQMTRDVLWQRDLMDHPNGAVSLEAVVICSDDKARTVARLGEILGGPPVALSAGQVEVISPDEFGADFPDHELPAAAPCAVALRVGVGNLAETAAFLAGQGVAYRQSGAGILRIGPGIGCGAIVEFVARQDNGGQS